MIQCFIRQTLSYEIVVKILQAVMENIMRISVFTIKILPIEVLEAGLL